MKIDKSKLKIVKMDLSMLEEYLRFEKEVKDHMEHPEWLGDIPKEDYISLLNNGSSIYLWLLENEIVASGMMIPARQKDLDKFFSSDLNYQEVIDFGPEMVNFKYIGNGLQKDIIHFLKEQSRGANYQYAIATIHPDNLYSIKNFLATDYDEIGQVDLKRGSRKVYRVAL